MAKTDKLTTRVQFRASKAEVRVFTRTAKGQGLSLSTWLRLLARRESGMNKKGDGSDGGP
jgi:hypothetical protein